MALLLRAERSESEVVAGARRGARAADRKGGRGKENVLRGRNRARLVAAVVGVPLRIAVVEGLEVRIHHTVAFCDHRRRPTLTNPARGRCRAGTRRGASARDAPHGDRSGADGRHGRRRRRAERREGREGRRRQVRGCRRRWRRRRIRVITHAAIGAIGAPRALVSISLRPSAAVVAHPVAMQDVAHSAAHLIVELLVITRVHASVRRRWAGRRRWWRRRR